MQKVSRRFLIQAVTDRIGGHTYVEIGVHRGHVFTSMTAPRKIGVDIKPPVDHIHRMLNRNVQYYTMPSDDFFARHANLFDAHPIDVAFVDGLHHYRQALRDIEHCVEHLGSGGVIIFHDCNPRLEINTVLDTVRRRAMQQGLPRGHPGRNWNGDVWKAVVHLRAMRRDLRVFVVDADHGLGVANRGKPDSVLAYDETDIDQMTWQDLDRDRERLLNLVPANAVGEFVQSLRPLTIQARLRRVRSWPRSISQAARGMLR